MIDRAEATTAVDASATQAPVSSGDAAATGRRHAGDRRQCPTCKRWFRRTALSRHRQRRHPEMPVPALEVEGKVVVRDRLLTQAVPCSKCHQTIAMGTPLVTLAYDREAKRRWSHLVCTPAAPPLAANTQTQNPPGLGLTALALATAVPTPNPRPLAGDPPTPSATSGDAIISGERLLDLGIVGTRAAGKTIVLELASANAEDVLRRLIGDDIVRCQTCAALGRTTAVPHSYLQTHDLTEHRDLWVRGRTMAEARVVQERAAKRALPPGGDP